MLNVPDRRVYLSSDTKLSLQLEAWGSKCNTGNFSLAKKKGGSWLCRLLKILWVLGGRGALCTHADAGSG